MGKTVLIKSKKMRRAWIEHATFRFQSGPKPGLQSDALPTELSPPSTMIQNRKVLHKPHATAWEFRRTATTSTHEYVITMLPAEILDQVTALNLQHGEVVFIINQLSRPSEITSQLVLDDVSAKIKGAFAEADRAIEVPDHRHTLR